MCDGFNCESISPCILASVRGTKFGAKAFKQTEVKSINIDTNGSFVVETTNGTFTAQQVVNAAGVWAPKIGRC